VFSCFPRVIFCRETFCSRSFDCNLAKWLSCRTPRRVSGPLSTSTNHIANRRGRRSPATSGRAFGPRYRYDRDRAPAGRAPRLSIVLTIEADAPSGRSPPSARDCWPPLEVLSLDESPRIAQRPAGLALPLASENLAPRPAWADDCVEDRPEGLGGPLVGRGQSSLSPWRAIDRAARGEGLPASGTRRGPAFACTLGVPPCDHARTTSVRRERPTDDAARVPCPPRV